MKKKPKPYLDKMLWSDEVIKAASTDKLNRRPISTDRRGFIKISCKSSPRLTNLIRHINLIKANSPGR